MADVCHRYGVKVGIVPGASDAYGPSIELDGVEGVTVLGVNPPVFGRTSRWLKRGFDFIVASLALLISAPLMSLAAIAIPIDSRGADLLPAGPNRQGRPAVHALQAADDGRRRRPQREELMTESNDPNWLDLDHDPRITRARPFPAPDEHRRAAAALERAARAR